MTNETKTRKPKTGGPDLQHLQEEKAHQSGVPAAESKERDNAPVAEKKKTPLVPRKAVAICTARNPEKAKPDPGAANKDGPVN
jgi:hypothetical protein